jgi:hypothetical protein
MSLISSLVYVHICTEVRIMTGEKVRGDTIAVFWHLTMRILIGWGRSFARTCYSRCREEDGWKWRQQIISKGWNIFTTPHVAKSHRRVILHIRTCSRGYVTGSVCCSRVFSNPIIIYNVWHRWHVWMNKQVEWRWTQRKTCPSASLSTKNPRLNAPGTKPWPQR